MARKIKVFLVDDIGGADGAETVEFSYGGNSYTIDLSERNRAKFDSAMGPFLSAATKVGRTSRGRRPAGKSAATGRDLASVREWARANGHKVSDRGRVPASVTEAYNAANGG